MVCNKILVTFFFFFAVGLNANAQVNSEVVRYYSPKYPEAVALQGVSGIISVEVVINKQGNVASSSALTGHILLRKISEEAAKQWIFNETDAGLDRKTVLNFEFILKDNSRIIHSCDVKYLSKQEESFSKPFNVTVSATIETMQKTGCSSTKSRNPLVSIGRFFRKLFS